MLAPDSYYLTFEGKKITLIEINVEKIENELVFS